MNEDIHINPAVSALVMLAAIASTYTVYGAYKDDQVATQYGEVEVSLNQTASALASLNIQKAAMPVATSTSATTTKVAPVQE